MSRWLALAHDGEDDMHTPLDSMTKPDKTPLNQPKGAFCQVLSNCQVGIEEKEQALMTPPQRWSVGGRPMTRTGRIVSLQEWQRMTRGECDE